MLLQTSFQQGGVGRVLFAHLVMRDDLVLRLLNEDQFAELIGLMRLALADHLGVRLKYAEQLSVGLGVAAQHSLPCLAQHLLEPGDHLIQLLLGFVQYRERSGNSAQSATRNGRGCRWPLCWSAPAWKTTFARSCSRERIAEYLRNR